MRVRVGRRIALILRRIALLLRRIARMAYKETQCPSCGYVAASPCSPSEPPSKKLRFSEPPSTALKKKTKKKVGFSDPIATVIGPTDTMDSPVAVRPISVQPS